MRDRYAFFRKQTVVATVAFSVAAMAAFYQVYSNMFDEQQNQTPSFGF